MLLHLGHGHHLCTAKGYAGNDTTQLFIERISDIDFHEQQYEIAFWLRVHWKGAVPLKHSGSTAGLGRKEDGYLR